VESPFEDQVLSGVGLTTTAPPEFNGSGAGEMERRPEVEVLPATPQTAAGSLLCHQLLGDLSNVW